MIQHLHFAGIQHWLLSPTTSVVQDFTLFKGSIWGCAFHRTGGIREIMVPSGMGGDNTGFCVPCGGLDGCTWFAHVNSSCCISVIGLINYVTSRLLFTIFWIHGSSMSYSRFISLMRMWHAVLLCYHFNFEEWLCMYNILCMLHPSPNKRYNSLQLPNLLHGCP